MSTLKIEIRESIQINANDYGSYNAINVNGINEVSKRMVTIPTTEQEIISLSTTVGSGTFIEGDVRYIRITNLSTDNPVILTFKNEEIDNTHGEFAIKLDKGISFIYSGISGSGVVNTMDATGSSAVSLGPNGPNMKDLTSISAQSSGSTSSDIEYFVASI
tara:strand:- start:1422 stop:1904 length:483 start_codon:yes stop_codon:yes gene_type:complete